MNKDEVLNELCKNAIVASLDEIVKLDEQLQDISEKEFEELQSRILTSALCNIQNQYFVDEVATIYEEVKKDFLEKRKLRSRSAHSMQPLPTSTPTQGVVIEKRTLSPIKSSQHLPPKESSAPPTIPARSPPRVPPAASMTSSAASSSSVSPKKRQIKEPNTLRSSSPNAAFSPSAVRVASPPKQQPLASTRKAPPASSNISGTIQSFPKKLATLAPSQSNIVAPVSFDAPVTKSIPTEPEDSKPLQSVTKPTAKLQEMPKPSQNQEEVPNHASPLPPVVPLHKPLKQEEKSVKPNPVPVPLIAQNPSKPIPAKDIKELLENASTDLPSEHIGNMLKISAPDRDLKFTSPERTFNYIKPPQQQLLSDRKDVMKKIEQITLDADNIMIKKNMVDLVVTFNEYRRVIDKLAFTHETLAQEEAQYHKDVISKAEEVAKKFLSIC